MSTNDITKGLFEKGPLAFLITGTTAVAFAASNLYVAGFSLALRHGLAAHFELLDYLRITPAWALPAALCYGIVYIYTIAALNFRPSIPGFERLRQFLAGLGWSRVEVEITLLAGITGICIATYLLNKQLKVALPIAAIVGTVWLSRTIPYEIGRALKMTSADTRTFTRTILGERHVETTVAWLSVLSFAFFFGLLVAPTYVRGSSTTRVVLAVEIPKMEGAVRSPGLETSLKLTPNEPEVEGILVFRLSHSVLLLTKRHGSPLVVIPEERIERIESLKTPVPAWLAGSGSKGEQTP